MNGRVAELFGLAPCNDPITGAVLAQCQCFPLDLETPIEANFLRRLALPHFVWCRKRKGVELPNVACCGKGTMWFAFPVRQFFLLDYWQKALWKYKPQSTNVVTPSRGSKPPVDQWQKAWAKLCTRLQPGPKSRWFMLISNHFHVVQMMSQKRDGLQRTN